MLGPTYLDFIRYFYCTCLTRPPDFLSRFRNLAGGTQRIKIDKIENQVVPAEEAGTKVEFSFSLGQAFISLKIVMHIVCVAKGVSPKDLKPMLR